MEFSKEIFTILAILTGTIANIPYILGMFRGVTKPHMFSWLIWAVVSGVGAAIQYAEGAGVGSWYMVYNTVFFLTVTIASIWCGTKDIKKSDWIILLGALLSIPVWAITKEPFWSVLIVVAIDGIAYFPTIRKSWMNPEQEVAFSWFVAGLAFAFTILALEKYAVTTYLYPFTFFFVNIGLCALLIVRRHMLKNKYL